MAFLFGHGEPFIMAFFLIADPGSENRSGNGRQEGAEIKIGWRDRLRAILNKSRSQGTRG
jgi:hypothetical protein